MDDLEAARDVRRSVRPRRAASPRRLVLAFVAALCCGPIMTGHAAAGNIPNQGGPVMATAKAFLIFWLPPNHSFASGNGGDATFETTIGNFFTDIHKSDYFDIATQYSGTCQGKPCSPQNTAAGVTLGGTWVDTGAFPETVLSDADIQAEVLRALAQNPKWKQSVGLGAEFFVFLPEGVQECDNGVCSAVDFCAYHDAFTNNGADVIYAVMPQVHSIGAGCSFNSSTATEWSPSLGGNFSPSTTPNQVEADWEIVPMSHEFFESVTDPLVSTTPAWFDPNGVSAGDTEIGDHCDLMVGGDIAANGSNVTLGAHNYLVQQIWSNGIPGCALGLTIKLTIVTGSDDLRGDSSATALLQTPAGSTLEQVTLKAQSDSGWPNNSTNERIFRYNGGQPLTLGDVDVTLTSHNSFPETDDNWNINGIDIKVLDPVGNALCDQSFNGNPVARLTGSAGTAEFDTPNCQPPVPPTATFSQIVFNIVTGGDDLRGDSSATASVNLPGGAQTFTLKAQSDGGWENNSDHVKSFAISPPQPLAAFGPITITLTSHNSFPETDDNWNIQNVDVTATGPSGQACVLNQGGNPLARLTGSGPSITLDPRAGCPDVLPHPRRWRRRHSSRWMPRIFWCWAPMAICGSNKRRSAKCRRRASRLTAIRAPSRASPPKASTCSATTAICGWNRRRSESRRRPASRSMLASMRSRRSTSRPSWFWEWTAICGWSRRRSEKCRRAASRSTAVSSPFRCSTIKRSSFWPPTATCGSSRRRSARCRRPASRSMPMCRPFRR